MFVDLRVKFYNFLKKHKIKIIIAIIIIGIIIAINIILGKLNDAQPPSISYEPHTPIVSGKKVSSKKTQESIEETIKNYMENCNSKQYENAYNMISSECKEIKFNNNIEEFKKYIDYIFDDNKVYSIQDYSNKDNIYIYKVTITEDIMATGMNTEKSDLSYEEMIVLTKENNSMKLAVSGFVSSESVENIAENEFMKITIEQKITYYDKVIYKVKIKNKTSYSILFSRDKEKETIGISLEDGDERSVVLDSYVNTEKVVRGNEEKVFTLEFNKYFDEESPIKTLTFNKVRVLEEYSGVEENWNDEQSKMVKAFSSTLKIK